MDRLDAMRLLVRVIDRRSFTAAAADLELPRSTATEAIRRLESGLGVRLLERTTRHVAPTPDGEIYYQRCLDILARTDEAEAELRGASPEGVLRIDAPGVLTRAILLPRLPEFMAAHPGLSLQIGQGERLVDLVREGVDCVIRAGIPDDSSMIMRRLAEMPEITCASPAYLERHGVPEDPTQLDGHQMIGFLSSRTGRVMPLEFTRNGRVIEAALPARVSANDADTAWQLARQGFGLIQAPRYRFRADLASGALVEVLPAYPPTPLPLAAFTPQNRHLAPRVRVFLDWASEIFAQAEF